MGENMTKYLAAALLTAALLTGAALAQTSASTKATTADRAGTMHKEGDWRASKLVGINVYNSANDKIGDISDVILDKSGKVENVVLGVGGFLGMGEHYVAVSYDSLKWSNEPPRSTTASKTTSSSNARPATDIDSDKRTASDARTTGAATTTDRKADGYWYPDHAIYNATKDQLKAMPQFKY
jgi:sporulation protein YlmC with PRC-barrel domain